MAKDLSNTEIEIVALGRILHNGKEYSPADASNGRFKLDVVSADLLVKSGAAIYVKASAQKKAKVEIDKKKEDSELKIKNKNHLETGRK